MQSEYFEKVVIGTKIGFLVGFGGTASRRRASTGGYSYNCSGSALLDDRVVRRTVSCTKSLEVVEQRNSAAD